MLKKVVGTTEVGVVAVFDDDNQRLLTEELHQVGQDGYGGVLTTLLDSALEQGQASYSELLQIKLINTHLARGIDNLLTLVTSFQPFDRGQVLSMLQQQVATLTLDSQQVKQQPHPLAMD